MYGPSEMENLVGRFFGNIEMETCLDQGVSRPRVRPVTFFPPDTRVEFLRALREMFPIGTRFIATVKVCQKHEGDRPKGPPYLKSYDVAVVASSVRDEGLMAKVRRGSISGISYEYAWKTKS